jgi:hypothetical protein
MPGVLLAMAAGGEGEVRQTCSGKYQEEQTGELEESRTSEHGLTLHAHAYNHQCVVRIGLNGCISDSV